MSVSSIGGSGGFDPVRMADEFFKKADSNGDGGIDKAELKTMISQGPGGGDVDKAFAEADTDGDSMINQAENEDHLKKIGEEMQAHAGKAGGGMPPGGGGGAPPAAAGGGGSDSKVYDPADTNKDGVVSAREELAYAAKHPELDQDNAQASAASDKIKSAVDDLMKNLQSGTKYDRQGSLSAGTEGVRSLFTLSA
jgi:Ca2+-binding EF-hand superfamily protein